MKHLTLILALALAAPALAQTAPDFEILDALLTQHVDAGGRVDYVAFKKDEPRLDAWLAVAAAAKPDAFETRAARLAFWINAYNAGCIKRVLTLWPVENVTKVPDFFQAKALKFAGRDMSLDDVEHGVIRKIFADPRVHAALVCAGKSCPKLRKGAYPAGDLDGALDAAMKEFLADPARNRFDPATGTAHLSQIFKWYADDFKLESGSLTGFLKPFAPPAAQELLARPDLKVDYLDYDFALNAR